MPVNPARPNSGAAEFLATRRSRPAKTLVAPAPDRAALRPLLEAALRVPDHGKLEPWRLLVLERPALDRLATMALADGPALGIAPEQIAKGAAQFADSPLCVAVIAAPAASDKVPQIEQTLSAGCVALSLVNAALAAGWGACWLSGWVAHDRRFAAQAFGLGAHEWIAGLIHIGTEGAVPPERPRPDLDAKVSFAA